MSGAASRETTNADAYAWIGLAARLWDDAAGNQDRPITPEPEAVFAVLPVLETGDIDPTQLDAALTGSGGKTPVHQPNGPADPGPVFADVGRTNPDHIAPAASSVIPVAAPGAGAPIPGNATAMRFATSPAIRRQPTSPANPQSDSDSVPPGTPAATESVALAVSPITTAVPDVTGSIRISAAVVGDAFVAASDQMLVSNGTTEVIQGDLAEPTTMIVVDGVGSELTVTGTLTTGTGGTYTYYTSPFPSSVTAALAVINGGTVQLGGLVLDPAASAPFAETVVEVDASSAIEIGSIANAVAGAIVIDAGRTLTALTTAGLYGNLIDNGTVLVAGGTLTQSGAVSGTGVIEISRGATWLLDGTIAPSVTISFLDSGAVLAIGGDFSFGETAYTNSSYALGDLLTGFRPGDAIELYDPITRANFTAGTNGAPGTLSLIDGNTTVEVLHLSGNFTGETFNVSQTASGGSVVTLLQAVAATAQATNADPYSWNAGAGGTWKAPGNWLDGATGSVTSLAPGSQTPVRIDGPVAGATDTIKGGGTSASVTLTGSVDLVGHYQVGGAVTVGTAAATSGQPPTAGSLGLAAGTTLSAASVNTFAGMFWQAAGTSMTTSGSVVIGAASAGTVASVSTLGLAGGALLGIGGDLLVNAGSLVDAGGVVTVAGTASLGIAGTTSANAGAVIVSQGGSMSVGGGLIDTGGILVADGFGTMLSGGTLTASGSGSYTATALTTQTGVNASVAAVNGGEIQVAGAVLSNATLLVDSSSSIEIGTTGGAAAGAITVDANRVVTLGSGSSTLSGAMVNNGTVILANGTLVQTGSVSGAGTYEIGALGTLVLDAGIAATDTIACIGSQAVISFAGATPANATLTGFIAGDALAFSQPVTALLYAPGSAGNAGTLTVSDGATTLATLGIIGDETGWAFAATNSGNGAIVSLVTNTATLGVQISGSGSVTQNGSLQVINLGTVPMGSASPSDTIGFANLGTLTAGVLGGSFTLIGTAGFLNGGFASGFSGVAAGQADLQHTVTLSTNNAGVFAETIVVTPLSIGNGSTIALSPQTIEVTGTVTPVSAALGVRSVGTAALSQNGPAWLLNLGTVALGAAALSDTIGIANTGTAAAATLSGTFSLSGTSGFSNSGFASGFSALGAGQSETQQTISLATGTAGVFSETIVISSTSTAGSSSTVLPNQTITVTGTVVIPNLSYTLTNTPTAIVAGLGNDSFNATSGVLNSQDSLNGGGGANTLNLLGAGVFDLGAPATLVNIQTVTATEGSSSPTVIYMRNGSGMTVNLSPASGGNGAAVIYGATGSDVFNLASGNDTVVLGSTAESVHAGGGAATIQAAAGLAGAVVTGGSSGTTTLAITSGGTVTLSALDTHLTVTLSAATHLNLGTAQFITALGSGQQDTITAGAANQTLVANGGNATLIGYAQGGDTFSGLASKLNGTLIQNFGGGDIIDITDLGFTGQAATLAVSGAGNNVSTALTLSDGTHQATMTLQGYYTASQLHIGSDGHGGSQVVAS